MLLWCFLEIPAGQLSPFRYVEEAITRLQALKQIPIADEITFLYQWCHSTSADLTGVQRDTMGDAFRWLAGLHAAAP